MFLMILWVNIKPLMFTFQTVTPYKFINDFNKWYG